MSDGLDLIILDDDRDSCEVLQAMARSFYAWGDVIGFTDPADALRFCEDRGRSLSIFVLDVFLGGSTAFDFLEEIGKAFPMAAEDSIIITGAASDDIVDMCMAAGVNHLLEKPIKLYAFQFAVRAIAGKYLRFAQKLMRDRTFALDVEKLEGVGGA